MINSLVCTWFAFCVSPKDMDDEIIIAANDFEQAATRVFKGIKYALTKEPKLRAATRTIGLTRIVTKDDVEIKAISSDAASAAGANFSLVSFDELWGFQSEGSRQLYEELTPVPTRPNSCRFISTYAGFAGISTELEELYAKMREGRCIDDQLGLWVNDDAGIVGYWDEKARLPWHTEAYLQQQRATLRPQAYDRLWRNQWTSGNDGLDPSQWRKCVREGERLGWTKSKAWQANKNLYLAVGIDASVKHDRAAVVTCFRRRVKDVDENGEELGTTTEKIFLGPRKVWQPTPDRPLDFEETIENFILDLQKNYMLGPVYYDPFQMVRSQQALWKKGVDMTEWTQTVPHGIEMCRHLMDLLSHTNLVLYDDLELQEEAYMVSLKEIPERGYRITKNHENKKIDSIIALAMASLAAELCPSSDDSFRDSLLILR